MQILKLLSIVFLFSCISALTSCASLTSGTTQTITVSTCPDSSAECCLENDKGKWYLPCTPGSVCVHRSYQDLTITAIRPGHKESVVRVKSKLKSAILGNVLIGGGIGAGIDCANGAAYEYPSEIVIPLDNFRKNIN